MKAFTQGLVYSTCSVMFTFWTIFGKMHQNTYSNYGYWCYLSSSLSPIDLKCTTECILTSVDNCDQHSKWCTEHFHHPTNILVLLLVNSWPHPRQPVLVLYDYYRMWMSTLHSCEYRRMGSFKGPAWVQWWSWSEETTQNKTPFSRSGSLSVGKIVPGV